MTDYKALLEWLTLPLRPRLRKERAERKRQYILKAIAASRRELRKMPASIRPKFEITGAPFKHSKKRK